MSGPVCGWMLKWQNHQGNISNHMKASLLASCHVCGRDGAHVCRLEVTDRHPWLSAGQGWEGALQAAAVGTGLHSQPAAALRADTCSSLPGVQAQSSQQAVPIPGDPAVPAPAKRGTRSNHCILKIMFLCFVLVFNLLNPQIQGSSYGDHMADSICIHVPSVLTVDAGWLCVVWFNVSVLMDMGRFLN